MSAVFALAAVALILVACGTPTPAAPGDASGSGLSDISVTDAWSRPTITMGDHGAMTSTQSSASGMSMNDMGPALYMLIENKGTAPDTLIGVTSDVAGELTLHETKDNSGMMIMEAVKGGIPIPAGSQVALKPAGLHVMMMGMTRDLNAGDTYKVTLKFASGKQVTADVAVRDM